MADLQLEYTKTKYYERRFNMIERLHVLLENLKQKNSVYYGEIAKLHAKIEECTAICSEIEKIKDYYIRNQEG
jgi:hypothetical protein